MSANFLSAGTYGLFDYLDNGSNITIIGYPASEAGNITIPSSINSKPVTTIGSGAFMNCSGLTGITIPTSVTRIEDAAFFNCYSLKITIPANVTTIGNSAFFGCASLTSITIPANVANLGSDLFASCNGLTGITVSSSNAFYSSSNGVLFNKNKTILIRHPGGKTGNYGIPSSVTTISSGAFDGCSGLTGVTIPTSVTSIGYGAFQNCGNLTSLAVPASVTSIGSSVFSGCGSLAAITVDPLNTGYSSADGVLFNKSQTILIQCPGGKTGNYGIPSGITTIGNYTFSNCRSLTSVTIPSGVTTIGSHAFSGCDGMTGITIPSSVTSIGSHAFSYCSGLTGVSIPVGVTNIGNSAFARCGSLTGITIPPGVTSIGSSAFEGCMSLTSLTIPSSVTSIGDSAFSGCHSLASVTIPSGVTSIGSYAFPGRGSLTTITVDSLNPAYSSADGVLFNKNQTLLIRCPGGKSGSYGISSGVTSIGSNAFEGCGDLTAIAIPSSVTSIGTGAFSRCSGLTSVAIPTGVTSIGNSAFSDCSGLASITIPSSVTSILSFAFNNCGNLTNVTIPSSVTTIGDSAFSGCGTLTAITVDSLNPAYSSADGVLFNKSQTILIRYPGGKSGDYTIPSGVTTISAGAFSFCGNLTGVTIPSSVTTIGSGAFSGCGSLASITVESSNPNYSSSDGALFNKTQTILIRFPGGKSGNHIIPSSVTTIGDSAFLGCGGLTSITISSSVRSIGSYAFSSCGSLTSVYIPSGVTSIGDGAFSACGSLAAITVDPTNPNYSSQDGILFNKSLNILIQCPGGKSGNVTIPASVGQLANGAFDGCEGLTSLCFMGNAPMEIWFSFSESITVNHFNGAIGFAPAMWDWRTVTNMGSSSPVKPWLIGYGYSYDTDWLSDPNGDGVNLLMAYAHSRQLKQESAIFLNAGRFLRSDFTCLGSGS